MSAGMTDSTVMSDLGFQMSLLRLASASQPAEEKANWAVTEKLEALAAEVPVPVRVKQDKWASD
jgi:hypothetical protein